MGTFKRFLQFLSYEIWRINRNEVNRTRFSLYSVLKILYLCVQRYRTNTLVSRASALTYSSLFSLVPILAILFAIARGFGLADMLEKTLQDSVAIPHENTRVLLEFVHSYLNQTKSGVFLGVGIVALFYSVINLTNNIEVTFNRIWHVRKSRTFLRKVTDYFSMFLLLPILIVISSGMSIYVGQIASGLEEYQILAPIVKVLIKLIPFVITWGMFTGLYVFMPNTHVQMRPAIISGITIGTAYQIFQFIYISSQVYVSRYNAIYGSFAALPLFLLWLQLSWSLILFGVELTYAQQNLKHYSFDYDTRNISKRYQDFVTILILSTIAKRFQNNDRPLSAIEISDKHSIPIRLVQLVLEILMEVDILHETIIDPKTEEMGYQPSLDLETLTVSFVINRINAHGSEDFKLDLDGQYKGKWDIILRMEQVQTEKFGTTRIVDIV